MLTATAEHADAQSAVYVRNLSARGALLGSCAGTVGTRLTLQRDGIRAVGSIVWTDSGQAAVRFERAIEPARAFRSIQRPIRSVERLGGRPALRCAPLTKAQEDFLSQRSVKGIAA